MTSSESKLHIADTDMGRRLEVCGFLDGHLPDGWAIADELVGATAILTVDVGITEDMIASAGDSLRIIGTVGPTVADSGSRKISVREFPPNSRLSRLTVAEFSVMLMFALTRNLAAMTRETAAGKMIEGKDKPVLTDSVSYTYNWIGLEGSSFLYGKVVGIVGLGAIGKAVAKILAPLGVRLVYTQRHRHDAEHEQELGVEWRTFDDLLRESDIITLHHRLNDGPRDPHKFGERELSMMKPTSFLINTARGGLIEEDALVEALRTQQIAGVGLDVFQYEPMPAGHPLLSLAGDNVILTPHIAAGSMSRYWQLVVSDLLGE